MDDDDARARLHDALRDIAAHHREYADTAWALPDEELTALEATASALRPRDPVRRAAWLFASDWVELGDRRRRDDFDACDAELARRRADAVDDVLADGLDAVERMAAGAKVPHAVGTALATAAPLLDAEMLAWLAGADDPAGTTRAETAYAYVAGRVRDGGAGLVDELIALTDDAVARALVLRAARDPEAAWQRLEALPDGVAEQYWKRFSHVGLGGDFPAVLEAARGLVGARRYAAALDMMALYGKRTDSSEAAAVAATALEGLLAGGMSDPELPGLASYDYQRVFGLLGRHRTAVGEQRVVNLEWQFFPALGFDADAPALHEALADHPGFFAELVGYVYKRDPAPAEDDQATGDDAEQVGADVDDEPESPLDAEQRREFATRAYRLLRSWRRCPGAGPDNRPDPVVLQAWVEQARARLAGDARLGPGDSEIGQALASAAPDEDGTTPPRAVRCLLKIVRSDRLDEGLELGMLNMRGVTSRGVYDGGEQEHDLAEKYRQDVDDATAWPRTRCLLAAPRRVLRTRRPPRGRPSRTAPTRPRRLTDAGS